jgi:hypothetical protein
VLTIGGAGGAGSAGRVAGATVATAGDGLLPADGAAVRLGPFEQRPDAEAMLERLSSASVDSTLVRVERQ